jgi:hypothetical protein
LETRSNNRKELKRTGLIETSGKENIFSGLSRKEYRRIRKGIIRMILSTDMKYHFEITQKFKSEVEKSNFNKENQKHTKKSINGADKSEVNLTRTLNPRIFR